MQPEAEQIMALANQARAAVGVGPLKWDEGLAIAARKHCLCMAAEGPIAHRYPGEWTFLSGQGRQAPTSA